MYSQSEKPVNLSLTSQIILEIEIHLQQIENTTNEDVFD